LDRSFEISEFVFLSFDFNDFDVRLAARLADSALRARRPREKRFQMKGIHGAI
jgi:hypothetical protein